MIKKATKAILLCVGVAAILYVLLVLPFLVYERDVEAIPIDSYEIAPLIAMKWNGSASGDTSLFNTATDTAYTDSVFVGTSQYFSAYIRGQSTNGTPNVKFYIMQSPHKDSTFVVPEGRVEFITVTDENWHLISVEPVVSDHLKYRAIGQTSNATDTMLETLHIEQPGRTRR